MVKLLKDSFDDMRNFRESLNYETSIAPRARSSQPEFPANPRRERRIDVIPMTVVT